MASKTLFNASFEESLNLEDDSLLQFQKQDYYKKLGKSFKKTGFSLTFQIKNILMSILFPIGLNLILCAVSLHLHLVDPEDLTIPISPMPFLTIEIYLSCLLVWFLLILVGKCVKRSYLFPYRYRFHIVTFLIWFFIEFNLLGIDLSLVILSAPVVIAIFLFTGVIAYKMLRLQQKRLKTVLYGVPTSSSFSDKIINGLTVYGSGIMGLILIINAIVRGFSITFSEALQGLGFLVIWIFLNIAVITILIFLELPFFLEAYYKWKYPESYREWEGKSVEEWYGENYLKKHKGLFRTKLN